ncbi:hypothetical protein SCUCBS95973_008958 [Sporothrix curviconia]|uniref:CHK kinase-like domain-containing protein n=1 Tax=Sporothrix curviconia TaxID=1260050 RepID=A0ABP0CTY4_9PEZI
MSAIAMSMPNSQETLTLEWLQAALQDTTISSFEVTSSRLFETTSKLYVTLAYSGDAHEGKPTHILLKGGFNPAMFAVPGYKPILLRVYTREVDLFTKFASTLPTEGDAAVVLQVPKVYWAGADADNAILAMEDLAHAGFAFGDPTTTYGLAAVHSGLEQLASLHAKTWGWTTVEGDANVKASESVPSAASLAWLEPNIYDVTMRGLLGMWDEVILGADRPALPAILKDSRERTSLALENYFVTRNPRFRCLVHGDPHSGNTYLKGDNVRFLDWQIAHIGTAFHDVAYFVVSMLTVEERRTHELAMLDYYLAALARHGGPVLSRENDPDVMTEYRKALMTGLGWVLTPHSMQAKARVEAMVERYAAAIVDHKTIELLTEGNTKETTAVKNDKASASVQVGEVAKEQTTA